MSNHKQVTRICSSCGIEKPLSAFLQISETQGTVYGSLCAICRASGKTNKAEPKPSDDERTTVSTGIRIGSKEKVYSSKEQKRQIKNIRELFQKEIKKREEIVGQKIQGIELKEKAEKEHRKFYLEGKQKQGFLGKKLPAQQQTITADKTQESQQRVTNEKERAIESQRQEDIIRQELQITSLDFSIPFIEPQTHQAKFQSDTFLKFKSWLGSSAPIVRTLEMLYGKKQPASQPTSPTQEKTATKEISKGKEAIEEYIEKRLNEPSSTRRR